MKFLNTYSDVIKYNNGKKVLVYGAGTISSEVLKQKDILSLDIIGVVDKKYQNRQNMTFQGFPAFSPVKMEQLEYDSLLVLLKEPKYIVHILNSVQKSGIDVFCFAGEKYPFDKYNSIYLIDKNGNQKKITEKDLPAGFNLEYTNETRNNVIKIELPQDRSHVNIIFRSMASNCYFELKSTVNYIDHLNVLFGEAKNMSIKINKDVSICSASICSNQVNGSIEIGNDCMIASGVYISASDGHSIFDLKTGKLINAQKHTLTIGNHVWLGDESRILKNAIIQNNSVVGNGSVVTKPFNESNIVIAGNPARIIKNNIMWKRDVITSLETKLEQ